MSEIAIKLNCLHYLGTKVVKNGRKKDETQNFLCRDCGKQFQRHYKYGGANPTIKNLLIRMLSRNSGIQDYR
ncbi:MAG: hypothetical protein NZ516_10260 [Raineya sp.]|nr:hypothetical protein [Raineya sp.]